MNSQNQKSASHLLHFTAFPLRKREASTPMFIGRGGVPLIVGYSTVEGITANKYVALGTVFEDVDGTDVAIKDLVTVGTPAGGANIGVSDQIWVWNTEKALWTKYFYYKGRQGEKWLKSTDAATADETADTIQTGVTFFFCRASSATGATTLTLSGKVKELDGSSSFTVSGGQLAFASNPWPIAINVKDFGTYYTSGSPVGGANIGVSDQIWLWNTEAAAWTKYFYYAGRQGQKWLKSTDAVSATETTDTIPAGTGFFFQRASSATASATITFESNK